MLVMTIPMQLLLPQLVTATPRASFLPCARMYDMLLLHSGRSCSSCPAAQQPMQGTTGNVHSFSAHDNVHIASEASNGM